MTESGRWPRWEALALVALTAAAFVGFFVYPTYPEYDSLYSMLWGRELLDGVLPSFEAYRAPTQHPLWVVICVPLAALGTVGDRVLLAICVLSFVALVGGMYRLGRESFGWAVGLVAALLLLSRLDFPFFAARGYIDIPYLALVVWAAVLEIRRPKRGGAVWVLLTLAGLMRPEAWVLAGIYGLWLARGKPLREWVRVGLVVAIAPVIWALSDFLVTGDPLYSLNYTTESARELGRRQALSGLPRVTFDYLAQLTKPPVFAAAIIGLALAWRTGRGRMVVPVTLALWGIGTFLLVSLRGFAVIDRYLLVAALTLMLFAAVALAGFTLLPRGHRLIRPWAAGSLVLVLVGVVYTSLTFNPTYFNRELKLRESVRHDIASVLASPGVTAGRACGPISVPNHKLIPIVRWVADADVDHVVARTDPAQPARKLSRGVELFVIGGTRLLKHPAYGPFDQTKDSPRNQVPSTGFQRVTVGRYFSAYTRC